MKMSEVMLMSKISPDAIVERALEILEERARYNAEVLSAPSDVRDFLRLRIGGIEHEEFWCIFLDAKNSIIELESMFRGTLTQTSVYPREVVKRSLQLNAASVIFAHNHPSGTPEPSDADERLTKHLKQALELIDVRVLDHLVVTSHSITSFAERGLL